MRGISYWKWWRDMVCDSLPKSGIFWTFLGPHSHPCGDWGEVLHTQADPGARRPCKVWPELLQRVAPTGRKKLIFGLWVNLIPAVFRFAAILPVTMVGDTTIVRSVCDQPLLFTKEIVRTIVVNSCVNLRPTCSCRRPTANRKSTWSRCHRDNFANCCHKLKICYQLTLERFVYLFLHSSLQTSS